VSCFNYQFEEFDMTLARQAFNKWCETSEGAGSMSFIPDSEGFAIFEAGWKAARAEPRSDAAQATGGRVTEIYGDTKIITEGATVRRQRLDKGGNWQTIEPPPPPPPPPPPAKKTRKKG
jgi:hypothetical protein